MASLEARADCLPHGFGPPRIATRKRAKCLSRPCLKASLLRLVQGPLAAAGEPKLNGLIEDLCNGEAAALRLTF
jgi:hypothetical protein